MKKISLIIVSIFTVINLYAQEDNKGSLDKLDILDQQSKNFFKSITGLEKDYLEEQIDSIQNKTNNVNPNKNRNPNPNINPQTVFVEKPEVSQEDYEKNVFKHQNEMARLTSDFTRTKNFKDIKIKSMYSFNGKDYVILKVDKKSTSKAAAELSSNIEGRYVRGDNILGHKIIKIDVRTKTVKLYKKVDDEYGYVIYLSNYGTSVSDLKKEPKIKEKTVKTADTKIKEKVAKKEFSIKESFAKIKNKAITKEEKMDFDSKKDFSKCLYTVNKSNLNVRNTYDIDATILRILRINDQFTIQDKRADWLHIDTIYKKKSGDVMVVDTNSNWVQFTDNNLSIDDDNCR
ncbi:hypothetical protein GA417_01640 [Poseidonibacter ostreae]|jgi:hypothetical protein|uniref:hypothetical protein n=1 Tax=Poseidonibacter ostreae TaxID=2654171 RepID=UPI0012649056|nr:hypothetical protein [Poseidonibacter ostreae]KAB7887670.1 hypothetical protein GA417_01640 [Poseidonibacter ostreae]